MPTKQSLYSECINGFCIIVRKDVIVIKALGQQGSLYPQERVIDDILVIEGGDYVKFMIDTKKYAIKLIDTPSLNIQKRRIKR